MQTALPQSQRLKFICALVLMILPAIVFYVILWRDAVSIPILDDYQIILGLLNQFKHTPTAVGKLVLLLTAEHNGYKLVFENAVVLVQYTTMGRLNLPLLVHFGNAFAFLTFVLVMLMSRLQVSKGADKLLLLVPAAWLIFQLQYASALDFASSSLQHLAVIFFSLLSIYLLSLRGGKSLTFACVALALAVASSPNGFFAGVAGMLLLVQIRAWRYLTVWVLSVAILFGAYIYRYQPDPVTSANASSASGFHLNAGYALSFLGASAARYSSVTPSFALGLLLCGVFLALTWKRYYRRNPAIYYSLLFILINAVAVSGLRSDLGIAQSLASRYRLYSNLFLAFSYMALLESMFVQQAGSLKFVTAPRFRNAVVLLVFGISVAFCCLSDIAGARFLEGKKQALTYAYRTEWQGETSNQAQAGLKDVRSNPALLRQIQAKVYEVNVPALREAVRNGVYQPPLHP